MTDSHLLTQLHLSAQTENLCQFRARVRQVLQRLACPKSYIRSCVLAVDEAASNVIRHAYAGNQGGLELEIHLEDGELLFRLTDFAPVVDNTSIRPRDLRELRPGGLGVHIIQQVMDQVEYRSLNKTRGNVLEMRRRLPITNNENEADGNTSETS